MIVFSHSGHIRSCCVLYFLSWQYTILIYLYIILNTRKGVYMRKLALESTTLGGALTGKPPSKPSCTEQRKIRKKEPQADIWNTF